MRPKLITSIVILATQVVFLHYAMSQGHSLTNAYVNEDTVVFIKHAGASFERYLIDPQRLGGREYQIDQKRLEGAVKNSAAWIRAILKDRFVPEDLESRIEGIPGGLEGEERGRGLGRWPAFDCTRASFEAGGYEVLVLQDSLATVFFVTLPVRIDGSALNHPDFWARELSDKLESVFRHASASLYIRAIRITDFGVEMIAPRIAWDSSEKGWKPSVAILPKACVEGVLDPLDEPRMAGLPALGRKMKQLDPTISAIIADADVGRHWWAGVYAATDGKVLVYSAPKTGPGQAITIFLPDWFRIAEPEEIPEMGEKAGQRRPSDTFWPPQ